MDRHRLTRRALVRRGVASTLVVGLALETGAEASAASDGNLVAGRFVSAEGARSAVVSLAGGRTVPVTLDSGAFVSHGADGVVDSLTAFVPGEEVAVRGARTDRGIVANEFQSVYTNVTGTLAADVTGHFLVTPSGPVRVPDEVAEQDLPSSVRSGETYTATIWVHPDSGEATAVGLRAES